MSRAICIMGESGSGKTTSLRNLPPEATYYIDCDKKGLSWRGWREQYNPQKKNYIATDNIGKIAEIIAGISKIRPNIHYIVIDTLNNIMTGKEMRERKTKGFDKWYDLAGDIWELVDNTYSYRDDLTLIFIAHSYTEQNESGYMFTKIKTNGRRLEKVQLESKFTTVLLAKAVDGQYIFETHANNSTCKTPLGAFDTDRIDNDIMRVLDALKDY